MTVLLAILALLPMSLDVTKEEVIRMAAAGVSDEAITSFLRSHGPVAVLSPDDVMDLREAQVSEAVIRAMIDLSAELPEYTPAPNYGYPWFYPFGSYSDFYYGTGLWGYLRHGRRHYPLGNHYYRYPNYRYGYHWQPARPPVHSPAHAPRVIAPRPPAPLPLHRRKEDFADLRPAGPRPGPSTARAQAACP
jgi:hypothetical protein